MTFRISKDHNDGLANAPALEVHVQDIDELLHVLGGLDTFTNDYGVPVGVGTVVTIERVS